MGSGSVPPLLKLSSMAQTIFLSHINNRIQLPAKKHGLSRFADKAVSNVGFLDCQRLTQKTYRDTATKKYRQPTPQFARHRQEVRSVVASWSQRTTSKSSFCLTRQEQHPFFHLRFRRTGGEPMLSHSSSARSTYRYSSQLAFVVR
jgi:hypothetical protein